MQVLWAVINDLLMFVCAPFKELKKPVMVQFLPERELTLALAPEPPLTLLKPPAWSVLLPTTVDTPNSVIGAPHQVYVQIAVAPLFHEPALSIDGVVDQLPYASVLTVVATNDLFWRVVYQDGTVWVEKSAVTNDKTAIYPTFTVGRCYLALDTETKKLRRLINDEFFTTRVHSPLLGAEYVLYRLQQSGRRIDWSNTTRPRLAGTWHKILKGKLGITIKISPKTGSVLEYVEGEKAVLGYVESVAPDETISISSIGRYKAGQYTEEVLTKTVWQELKPLWLQIN